MKESSVIQSHDHSFSLSLSLSLLSSTRTSEPAHSALSKNEKVKISLHWMRSHGLHGSLSKTARSLSGKENWNKWQLMTWDLEYGVRGLFIAYQTHRDLPAPKPQCSDAFWTSTYSSALRSDNAFADVQWSRQMLCDSFCPRRETEVKFNSPSQQGRSPPERSGTGSELLADQRWS